MLQPAGRAKANNRSEKWYADTYKTYELCLPQTKHFDAFHPAKGITSLASAILMDHEAFSIFDTIDGIIEARIRAVEIKVIEVCTAMPWPAKI
mmetsp:Transcript_14186/g.32992  ORF Transcript_14186/g.32992 Transcript_14186/m.32992 type:complete len:93 (+) Transcript_14186:312-590(+)